MLLLLLLDCHARLEYNITIFIPISYHVSGRHVLKCCTPPPNAAVFKRRTRREPVYTPNAPFRNLGKDVLNEIQHSPFQTILFSI